MRGVQDTTIDGWTYSVRTLPAGQGLHLMTRLSKLLGGALASLVADDGDGGVIGRAVTSLVDRADPDAIVAIARELSATAVVSKAGGSKPAQLEEVFDVHFAGNFLPLFDFLRFALEVNFAPFVEGLKARAAARRPAPDAAAGE